METLKELVQTAWSFAWAFPMLIIGAVVVARNPGRDWSSYPGGGR